MERSARFQPRPCEGGRVAEESFKAAQIEMGEALKNTRERKCRTCGELIRHDGKFWTHVYSKPRHPAEPG